MPMWRCPHCATPQPEAARCWVCHRSSTSCATCRHFRLGVASRIGYCGLDRRRSPLRGDELRGCWTPAPAVITGLELPSLPASARTPVQRRDFVPVGEPAAGSPAPPLPPSALPEGAPGASPTAAIPWANRVTLWGDPER